MKARASLANAVAAGSPAATPLITADRLFQKQMLLLGRFHLARRGDVLHCGMNDGFTVAVEVSRCLNLFEEILQKCLQSWWDSVRAHLRDDAHSFGFDLAQIDRA